MNGIASLRVRVKARVLASLDETTYKGGTMGKDHPVAAMRKEMGEGRIWYTALGHTEASFSEPLFLKHLLGGIEVAAGVKPARLSQRSRQRPSEKAGQGRGKCARPIMTRSKNGRSCSVLGRPGDHRDRFRLAAVAPAMRGPFDRILLMGLNLLRECGDEHRFGAKMFALGGCFHNQRCSGADLNCELAQGTPNQRRAIGSL